MSHDNGGQAFSSMRENNNEAMPVILNAEGMTLHDYFMAKVAQGLSANPNYVVGTVDEIVAAASKYATAMIAEKRRLEKEGK
jgi:hypothetical protein